MKLSQIVEALLFASKEPVDSKKIAKIIRKVFKREDEENELCSVKQPEIDETIEKLNKGYERKKSPYLIQERSTGWRIYTRIEYASFIRELFPDQKPTRLSAPALETLAIVAYRQPITKAAIEAVRGVNVDGVLQSLIERDWLVFREDLIYQENLSSMRHLVISWSISELKM